MDFNNKLIVDSTGSQQYWHFVEYPMLGLRNTSKHTGQTYLIIQDGTLYGHLQYQSNKHKVTFPTGAMPMTE